MSSAIQVEHIHADIQQKIGQLGHLPCAGGEGFINALQEGNFYVNGKNLYGEQTEL